MLDLSRISLNALRFFEVAARLNSFKDAGRELHVSPSAVSKQVATLEAQLGLSLFERRHRHIELTEDGHYIADIAHKALQVLKDNIQVWPKDRLHQIHVTCDADFALLWLLPRLKDFETKNPHLRVSLKTSVALSDPPEGDHDCAIIWGRGTWAAHRFAPLMSNTVFPVATPSFFHHLGRDAEAEDVASEMLIHDQNAHWWTAFRAVTGATSFDPKAGRIYGQTALCLDAASRGMGIAIGDEVSSGEYIESGKLLPVLGARLPSPDAYYIIRSRLMDQSDRVNCFQRWLMDQVQAHEQSWASFWRCQPDFARPTQGVQTQV